MIFGIKEKFDPYNVLLAIAKNTPMRLKTGFVVQGHICFHSSEAHSLKYNFTLK